MSDTEAAEPQALPGDGLREGIVDELRRRIGDQLLETELKPNDDLWVRVATSAWRDTGEALYQMGFEYFCFLSAIDWMPSPYGRGEDDPTEPPPVRSTEVRSGVTGGDTRFQVFARVTDIRRHVGVTIKTDVADDALSVESWFTVYAGANWHERETHEMFGIGFDGHPDLRNMYLPTGFEGFPLRKDFPLLARMVKPWPGIVDVEPMPATDEPSDDAAGEVAPQNPTPDQVEGGVGEPPAEDTAGVEAVAHSVEEAPDHQTPPAGDEARTDSAQGVFAQMPVDAVPTEPPPADAAAATPSDAAAEPSGAGASESGTDVVDGTAAVDGDDATGERDGGPPQHDGAVVDEAEVAADEGAAPTTDEAVPSGRPADEALAPEQPREEDGAS